MPSLSADVLALLACPICRDSLKLEHVEGVHVIRCVGCDRKYPFVDDIPVLIAERATVGFVSERA